jgi:predicted glycoside hydrolase/deacetylase ChbG (UPF0249 family)
VLCADDYGIAPGVGKAIRDLIARGRLSATSCMTVSPYWLEEGAALKPYLQRADIGLHFTLTDQRPLGPMPRTAPSGRLPSLPSLLLRALARRLDRAEIAAELNRQLDAFEAVLGRPPHYIDGHQHAHQLPVVREVVIEAFRARLGSHGGYLRYCTEPPRAILARPHAAEAMIIHLLGRRLRELGRAAGIPGNPRFSGVHDFSGRRPYGALFASFVRDAAPGLLVMCHPGLADAALAAADRVTTAREAEYRYLLSDAFLAVLRENNLGLSRFASGRPVAS